MPLIELENVSKRYPAPGGDDGPWVLRDVSLTVAEGEIEVKRLDYRASS